MGQRFLKVPGYLWCWQNIIEHSKNTVQSSSIWWHCHLQFVLFVVFFLSGLHKESWTKDIWTSFVNSWIRFTSPDPNWRSFLGWEVKCLRESTKKSSYPGFNPFWTTFMTENLQISGLYSTSFPVHRILAGIGDCVTWIPHGYTGFHSKHSLHQVLSLLSTPSNTIQGNHLLECLVGMETCRLFDVHCPRLPFHDTLHQLS